MARVPRVVGVRSLEGGCQTERCCGAPFAQERVLRKAELLSVTELPLEALLCGPLGEKRFEPCELRRHHERWALRSPYLCARDVGGKSSPPHPLASSRLEVPGVENC